MTAGQTVIAERLAEDAAYALMTRLTSTALPTDIPVGSEYFVKLILRIYDDAECGTRPTALTSSL